MRNQANSRPKTRIDAEVAQFDAVGGQWWDEAGPFRPLHMLNPVRMQYIVSRIQKEIVIPAKAGIHGLKILDIACGGGLVTEPLARLGANITGIDTSAKAIAAARAHATADGLKIDYQICALEEFAQKSNVKFDVITALEILEHVDSPADFVKTATELLKPGGMMVFSTINRTVKSLLLAKIAAEEILGWVPRGTHSWQQFIQPAELAAMAEAAQLAVTDIMGLAVNPIRAGTHMFTLSTDVAVNYFLTAKKSR